MQTKDTTTTDIDRKEGATLLARMLPAYGRAGFDPLRQRVLAA
jgi:hypothetical protein